MAKKPRILYVTTALHAPPHGGCMIRTTNICHQLKKCADLTMLAVSPNLVPESVQLCQREFQPFHKIDIKKYSSYPGKWGDLLKKWHMHNPFTQGVQATQKDHKLFGKLAAEHDIIWFHTLGAAFPFALKQDRKMVMDLDDLRDSYYQQYAEMSPSIRFKWSAKVQAYKWKKHQTDALKQYDRVIVCSEDDRRILRNPDKVRVIPNGYMSPPSKPQWYQPDSKRIGFIGLLTYPPNRDGLVWFRDHVWPLIQKRLPNVSLRIIGKLPASENYVEGERFDYLGFLENTTDEMNTWSSLIVPITYGGGTRIKILDAFSKMTPVIATPIGAHGIKAQSGEHLLIADDPDEFANHCIELLATPEKGRELAEKAWQLFSQNYSWDVLGISLKNIIEELVD